MISIWAGDARGGRSAGRTAAYDAAILQLLQDGAVVVEYRPGDAGGGRLELDDKGVVRREPYLQGARGPVLIKKYG